MKSPASIAVVVPCYNEEKRLNASAFINELSKNSDLTFLFVNDGSTDNTLKVIQKICEANPEKALCLPLEKNKGKGEAVRVGMLHLLENGSYNIIGFWDADLAVPLPEVWNFADVFRKNPNVRAVIGSRVHLAGRLIERINLRHYLGRFFATVMCWTFDFRIYDTQCGAKLFDREVLAPAVQEPFCSKWIFDVELILRITRLPFFQDKIAQSNNKDNWLSKDSWLYEAPVEEWRDVSGTKRTISAYLGAFYDYFCLLRKYYF